jgi:uncharacterized protein
MTADQVIQSLNLKPHPEGGYYRETYRGPAFIPSSHPRRVYSTAIYYLLVPNSVSKLHRIKADETFHFYLGDPVTWVLLEPQGNMRKVVLGKEIGRGQQLQLVIPAGTWFGGYLNEGGAYGLMGTTVAPGFEFEDFELGNRNDLIKTFPEAEKQIIRLT